MKTARPTFSVVINTLNRGDLLQKTLESFRWQRYDGDFEIIVVNGPSTDNSQQVIESWLPHIRAGRCEVANLSVSRNIGICMAQGDIVAFIDDDAIPEPEWLSQLADAYESDEIGGAGGLVFDHTGYRYQYQYSTANRLANANWAAARASEHLCFPGSFEFPYLQGTNASFRRSALLEIGGFDEEFEFYLDETDVCCRLVDAGYVIRQLACAYVHHKFAPSHIRDTNRVTRVRFPVLKNKIYFSLKHGRPYQTLAEIFEDDRNFSNAHLKDIGAHVVAGNLPSESLREFAVDNERAWDIGVTRGLHEDAWKRHLSPAPAGGGAFNKFPVLTGPQSKSVVLVSCDYPPNHAGGIATFNKDLAEALATDGHIVHVVTQSSDIDRVDMEAGVWVHRRVISKHDAPQLPIEDRVPQHLWDWSATALEEVERISTHRKVDVIEAPIWDCEGVAFLLDGRWPLVTSLQTTLHFWLDSHPDYSANRPWMESFGRPVLALEKRLMRESDAIRSISIAIRREIERAYRFQFEDRRVTTAPLGLKPAASTNARQGESSELTVLFVGRLEARKGVDTLLAAIPDVMKSVPGIRFRLLGDNTLAGPDGRTYQDAFLATPTGHAAAHAIAFEGRVDDETLADAYATCDIFVAPSRFESFGLVFLEAMREGKPVIGCHAGGVPEIVVDGETGLLVSPGDSDALAQSVVRLAQSASLRAAMGKAGLARFGERFTRSAMAKASATLYDRAIALHVDVRQEKNQARDAMVTGSP